jgi:hypothetical protein
MPVLFAGGKPDDVARPDFLDRTALALRPAAAERDDEGLAERMGMPGRACARLERDGGASDTRRRTTLEGRVDADGAREIIRRALCGGRRPRFV